MELGRVGVWLGGLGSAGAAVEAGTARELERLGFGTLWFGETPFSKEAFAHAALLLGATERITIATGIASIWLRSPQSAANGAAVLAEAHPGRFVLGLGVSHAPAVASVGRDYVRPLTQMRSYLDAMDATQYRAPAPAEPAPRAIGALAPKMLELARDRTQGAHPYLVTPEHTAHARAILGTGPALAPEQGFVLETDAARARAVAREHIAVYLTLENYRNNWLRLGFGEAELDGGGSDRLVDALVAWGDVDAVRSRVDAHLAAGADHVALQAVGPDPVVQLQRLAPALGL
jgi:probable F420-dependent oxidoreductase